METVEIRKWEKKGKREKGGKKGKMDEYAGKCWKMTEKGEKGGNGRSEGWEPTTKLPAEPNGSHNCPELRENATFHQDPKIAKSYSKEFVFPWKKWSSKCRGS